MHTVELLRNLVDHHQVLVYAAIYAGLIAEGEFILLSAGALAHLGALPLAPVLILVLAGGFSKTFLGYELGKFLRSRWNGHALIQFIHKKLNSFLPGFTAKPFWSLFISKFIMGANNIAIIFSGYERIDYKRYLRAEISSTLVWAPSLLALGYFFGYTALNASADVWKFITVIGILFALFVLFDKLVSFLYEIVEEFYNEHI